MASSGSSSNKLFDHLYGNIQANLYNLHLSAEEKILYMFQDGYEAVISDLAKVYGSYAVDGKLSYSEMSKYNRLKNLEKQISQQLSPRLRKKDAYLKQFLSVMYEESFYQHAYAIDQNGGCALKWGLLRDEDVEAIALSPLSKLSDSAFLKADRDQAVFAVRKAVLLAIVRGDGYPQMAKSIREVLGIQQLKNGRYVSAEKGQLYKSLRIARTEGQRAVVAGQQKVYEKALGEGVELEEVWDAALDSRTRPEHGALDGKPRLEKGWNVPSIGWVEAPLHSGVASFDIHCRCRVRGQIKGYPPQVRGVKGKGQQPWVDYESWKKAVQQKGSAKSVQPSRVDERIKKINNFTKLEELQNYVVETGYAEKVNFKGVPFEIARDWSIEIVRQYERIPELQPMKFLGTIQERNKMLKEIYTPIMAEKIQEYGVKPGSKYYDDTLKRFVNRMVGRVGKNTVAQKTYDPYGYGISINKLKAKDYDKVIKDCVDTMESGWWSKGTPEYHTVAHEMGHEVDALIGLRKNPEILNAIRGNAKNISVDVSRYGSTSVEEAIAEVWAEYTTNESPRPFVKNVGDKIIEEYKKWQKKR